MPRNFLIQVALESYPHERGLALGWGFIIHQERERGRGEDGLLLPPGVQEKRMLRCAGACARVALKRVLMVQEHRAGSGVPEQPRSPPACHPMLGSRG